MKKYATKIFALFLTLTLLLAFTACSSDLSDETSSISYPEISIESEDGLSIITDDKTSDEPTETQLTAEEAMALYKAWLERNGEDSTETRYSPIKTYELFGKEYYWITLEDISMYWYNILVDMETSELFFMMTPDGPDPIPTIEPLDDWSNNSTMREDSILVCNGLLIGGFDGAKWVESDILIDQLTSKETYRLYSTEGRLGEAFGRDKRTKQDDPATWWNLIEMSTDMGYDFAVSCAWGDDSWSDNPRTPVKQELDQQMYKDVVRDILVEKDLENPVINIKQNYRIDLEGDGVDEVVLYAEYSSSDIDFYEKKVGNYSLLILRKIINDEVENIILAEDIVTEKSDPAQNESPSRNIYGIIGFADLNGDGILELITLHGYNKGNGYSVYEIQNNRPVLVLDYGVGV